MKSDNLNKETILKLFGLLPTEQLRTAIASLENEAIRNETAAQKHLDEAKKLRADVDELKTALGDQVKNKVVSGIVKPVSKSGGRNSFTGGTFKTRIEKLLSDGIPKTQKELLLAHFKTFGEVKHKAFSSQLSTLTNVDKSVRFSAVNVDNRSVNYYGLTSWFNENGELKLQYIDKIKKPLEAA